MVLQELYMMCNFALVVASPHLTLDHPVFVIMVAGGILFSLAVIVALLVFVVARQFELRSSFPQSGGAPPRSHFTPQITRCGRGTPMPRAPTSQMPVA
ncbi:hypothetical protein E3T46_09710 [Cryobacterium sp. Hh11]|uniref:hypothetical protein n=1 Tax=Cryobacterium sp. Hh11 TaxID=2555868 RepID=UPI00106AB504|nr:hypothetical protein [Cryobacterium sp. Hh11]TFD51489.1 hypothetical protein E3T46_09710 [Cryobacterium sp. Hh11]